MMNVANSGNDRKSENNLAWFIIGLMTGVVLMAMFSCNSTHKVQSDHSEMVKKDSAAITEETHSLGFDSSVEDNSFHSHFSTGDSTLDNELTIVFDSVANNAFDTLPAPVIITQQEGSITVNAGRRKIKSIAAKSRFTGSKKESIVDSSKVASAVAKRDTAHVISKANTHQQTATVIKSKDVKKSKVPWVAIGIISAVMLVFFTRKRWLNWLQNKIEK